MTCRRGIASVSEFKNENLRNNRFRDEESRRLLKCWSGFSSWRPPSAPSLRPLKTTHFEWVICTCERGNNNGIHRERGKRRDGYNNVLGFISLNEPSIVRTGLFFRFFHSKTDNTDSYHDPWFYVFSSTTLYIYMSTLFSIYVRSS